MIPICFQSLLSWPRKKWLFAIFAGVLTYVVIAIPTAVIKNPIFGREIGVTSWSVPVLIITSILSGILFATYIRTENYLSEERSVKIGSVGGLFSFLAVGCPACNKIALLALGTTGAINYFAPIQPYLGLIGILLLLYAVQKRLVGESMCKIK